MITKIDGNVYLSLDGKRRRNIGTFRKNSKGVRVYRKYENSIFRKYRAFGICQKVITDLDPDLIKIQWVGGSETERGIYIIGKRKMKKECIKEKHKGEERCYIPIDKFHFRRER
jgi:hypothetical protein|tara:strand:- start:5018 stop:5359 length:342 start_codon:yes stop_codon:yes gene_type:complete